jgi:hypothetical protein
MRRGLRVGYYKAVKNQREIEKYETRNEQAKPGGDIKLYITVQTPGQTQISDYEIQVDTEKVLNNRATSAIKNLKNKK